MDSAKIDGLRGTNVAHDLRAHVHGLLKAMTLREKIGQMTQVEKNSLDPDDVAEYTIGSVLSGGGGWPANNTAQDWAQMVRSFQEPALRTRLGIPLLYGVDAIHGHNNMVGAVIFPHNIGLGATRDPLLVTQAYRAAARELLATGIHWNFAPALSVPRDIRWGRTYEGFGEEAALVSQMGVAAVKGLQGTQGHSDPDHSHLVAASIKHFVGDGGTRWGSTGAYDWIKDLWVSPDQRWSIDQGITDVDEETLRRLHLAPYRAAVDAGACTVMVSYSSWDGLKMHAHHYLLTEVLKGELGFEGFIVSDWMAIDQIDADFYTSVVASINAGVDMAMVPFDFRRFIKTLEDAVKKGDVSMDRIDDAVRRILTVKAELGLFESPFGDETLLHRIGSPEHRAIGREAVGKSLVLLKNEGRILPLEREIPTILVAGQGADDIGIQCGGWTIDWQGKIGAITPGTTLLEAVREAAPQADIQYCVNGQFEPERRAEVGLVVLAEMPYAEGEGDRSDLNLSQADLELVALMREKVEKLVVILYSGRPLILGDLLEQSDGLIAAWLPGTEGGGIADALFGIKPFSGRLPHAWPRTMQQVPRTESDDYLFDYGYGLTT